MQVHGYVRPLSITLLSPFLIHLGVGDLFLGGWCHHHQKFGYSMPMNVERIGRRGVNTPICMKRAAVKRPTSSKNGPISDYRSVGEIGGLGWFTCLPNCRNIFTYYGLDPGTDHPLGRLLASGIFCVLRLSSLTRKFQPRAQ